MITKFDIPFELTNPIPDVISVKDVKKRIDQVFNETCDAYRGNT